VDCNASPSVYLSRALQPFVGPWPLFQFLLYTIGRTPWTEGKPVARPLHTHRTTQMKNKRTQISMPWTGFETTIPVFEREKTVYALDRAATVIGVNPPQYNDQLQWRSRFCSSRNALTDGHLLCQARFWLRFTRHVCSANTLLLAVLTTEACSCIQIHWVFALCLSSGILETR
jgi:hypothetical protein